MPVSGELITIGLAAVAAIVWLVRLEGRVNTAEKVAAAMDRDLAATNARAEAEAKAQGRPKPFTLKVKGLRLSAGAGFVVVLCGAIVTMPGLPKEPQAWHIDGADGRRKVTGIK
jgi:formate--tetrahydrofolate ligase